MERSLTRVVIYALVFFASVIRFMVVAEFDNALVSDSGLALTIELSDSAVEDRFAMAKPMGIAKLEELRKSLTTYKGAVIEFSNRCRRGGVWPAPPAGDRVARGFCIYHLALFLASAQGKERTTQVLKLRGLTEVTWDIESQIAIAKDVALRHGVTGRAEE